MARKAVAKRKRVVTKAAFNKLRFVAHPDTGSHASDKQRGTAARMILNELTPYVLDEADEPTQWDSDLPNDLAGWQRLADAELKRRMRVVPQPKGCRCRRFFAIRGWGASRNDRHRTSPRGSIT